MPKLITLTTTENSWAFYHPRSVTLESGSILVHSLVDIPELKEVVLPKGFSHARTVVTQGSIFVSHESLLDVGAFQSNQSQIDIATPQNQSQKDNVTPHTVFDCCSTYSLPCYHTHSCTSHHSHHLHFLSILAISTYKMYHTFSQSSLHSPFFFSVLPTAFTHLS